MFSETEEKVLSILAGKKLTIKKIRDVFFKDTKMPINPNSTIVNAISRINKKCKFHKLRWHIDGEGLGRQGKTVWITKGYNK